MSKKLLKLTKLIFFLVVASYRWLIPRLAGKELPGSSEIMVYDEINDMDGGLLINGAKGHLQIRDFDPCLQDPSKCHHGFSLSFKLKLDQVSTDSGVISHLTAP